MSEHAVLSPSGATRWLACTPSARLEQQFPDNSGKAASEGTLAHKLGETMLRYARKLMTAKTYNKIVDGIIADPLYDHSMQEHAENYTSYVLEKFAAAQVHTPDAMLFLETLLDMTAFVPEGFGTGDSIIIADHILEIIDLKYGKGVPVYAPNNAQMMLYALGAVRLYGMLYSVKTIRMTIYQPRIDNISTWEIDIADLLKWAANILIPRAKLAFAGEGEFTPGAHCRFCKAKAQCKANADYNLQLAKYDFKDGVLLDDSEIADILDRADAFVKWLSGIEQYALTEAVNNHKKFPGYKLVEGRSNRRFTDEGQVVATLVTAGVPEERIFKPRAIVGITEMEKIMGKSTFNAILSPFIAKAPGAPTLVPASDKRPEYSSIASALKDFEDIELNVPVKRQPGIQL